MSEPHELEERCAMAIWDKIASNGFAWEEGDDSDHAEIMSAARAVLALVRANQEIDDPENRWAKSWIRLWWLSHTAPQQEK